MCKPFINLQAYLFVTQHTTASSTWCCKRRGSKRLQDATCVDDRAGLLGRGAANDTQNYLYIEQNYTKLWYSINIYIYIQYMQ